MGSTDSDGVSRVPPYLGSSPGQRGTSRTGLSPSPAPLSRGLRSLPKALMKVPQPRRMNPAVWAPPLSLATTRGISVDFFSSGYWDVSLPPVRLQGLWIQPGMAPYERCRIAPFGNPWVKGRLRLSTDYRGLPRPSSPSAAKASVMRRCSLARKKNSLFAGQSLALRGRAPLRAAGVLAVNA